jgi:single-strand DNA-binding protein
VGAVRTAGRTAGKAAGKAAGSDLAGLATVHDNRVSVTGRVSGAAVARTMPSGDEMVTWRIVIDRPETAGRGPGHDVLDCVAWSARLRRGALGWAQGDIVTLEGALRRRFWRSPGGLQSRCEIEVTWGRRIAAAKAPLTRRRKPE